uniref:Uncharacterized protein n=1 Tax=Anguilla anguilla TaxID=7936 RepID=A0A0E9SFJ2_ANGAN
MFIRCKILDHRVNYTICIPGYQNKHYNQHKGDSCELVHLKTTFIIWRYMCKDAVITPGSLSHSAFRNLSWMCCT